MMNDECVQRHIHRSSFIIHHFVHPQSISAMSTEPWTVGRLLQWTTDYLKGHGSESPRLDAEVLLAQALGCQRIELYTTLRRDARRAGADGVPRVGPPPGRRHAGGLSGRPAGVLLALVPRHARRADPPAGNGTAGGGGARSGEGSGSGSGQSRKCRRRSESTSGSRIAHLVPQLSIADVGTGSGIIAVCLAKHLPACRVTAIDISPAALAVARENAQQHGVADRIEFLESDLFAAVPAERQFDFIVSNPPYVTAAELDKLAARRAEVRAARGAVGRPAGHGSDRAADCPSGRASAARRAFADGDQPDDSRRGAGVAGGRRPLRARPDDQGPRPAAARGAGEKKGLGIGDSRPGLKMRRVIPDVLACQVSGKQCRGTPARCGGRG